MLRLAALLRDGDKVSGRRLILSSSQSDRIRRQWRSLARNSSAAAGTVSSLMRSSFALSNVGDGEMRNIGEPSTYSVNVFQKKDRVTWGWHIVRAGRTECAGKTMPVQRSVKKYRAEDEARVAANAALGELLKALEIVAAKRR